MSTHAHYILWAGVLLRDLPDEGYDNSFVQNIRKSLEPVDQNGRKFVAIFMHGETVGIGVEILDLEWTTVEEGPSEFERATTNIAGEVLREVNAIFSAHSIKTDAKLYHHLDLGG